MVPSQTPARISLPDRYRVVRHLANGGMASVWEAHDELLDRAVAVKLLAPHLSEDERARRRFQREARAAAGIVHRDIKPANMLVDERDRLAIADFGIARLAWEDQLTATGQVLGTAAYISPEQAMGEPASAASDRYSLAVVAFELLTGTKPFRAEHFAAQARAHVEDPPPAASERAPDLPPRVDDVLERGLAKDPRERWPSAAAFVDALRAALAPRRATPIAGPPTA